MQPIRYLFPLVVVAGLSVAPIKFSFSQPNDDDCIEWNSKGECDSYAIYDAPDQNNKEADQANKPNADASQAVLLLAATLACSAPVIEVESEKRGYLYRYVGTDDELRIDETLVKFVIGTGPQGPYGEEYNLDGTVAGKYSEIARVETDGDILRIRCGNSPSACFTQKWKGRVCKSFGDGNENCQRAIDEETQKDTLELHICPEQVGNARLALEMMMAR